MRKKVLLGMSGGVDSSAAAVVLQRAGFDVSGATMYMSVTGENPAGFSPADIIDARRVAERLGIGHTVLDFSALFKKEVVDCFVSEYFCGRTPNPCVVCNRRLKFGAMLSYALENGFDYVATGHYALVEDGENGRRLLKRSGGSKDQSYALYSLKQEQLAHILTPLAGYTKDQIRALAAGVGLSVADKPDSQDICFIKGTDYASFIEKYSGRSPLPGDIVDTDGNVIGRHNGIIRYTIGQRKGLGFSFPEPRYVAGIDAAANRVIIGQEGCQYSNRIVASQLNFIPFDVLKGSMRVTAKTRYRAKDAPAVISPREDGTVLVEFDEPQRSPTPGQSVVFYDGELVVGGGIIESGVC